MFFFMLFFGEDFVTIFQITILTAIRSCTEVCQKEKQIFHGRVQNHIEQLIQCLRHAQISTRCFPSPPKKGPCQSVRVLWYTEKWVFVIFNDFLCSSSCATITTCVQVSDHRALSNSKCWILDFAFTSWLFCCVAVSWISQQLE